MRKLVVLFISIIFFANFSIIGFGQNIDLVEMKKKEEERRKKLKKSKYKLNNSNLNKINIPKKKYSFMQVKPDSKLQKEVKNNDKKKASSKVSNSDPMKTKKYWQDLKNQLQNEITSLKGKIDNDQLKLNQLNTDLTSMGLPAERASLKNEIDKLTINLNQDRKKLKNLQEELDALYERARKAGIPPGWLR